MQRHQCFVFALAATLTARALAQDRPPTDESLAAYADTTHSVTLADGREIHFVCMGAGSPTVILTAALNEAAMSGEPPSKKLLESEAKSLRELNEARGKLLAAMADR